MRDGTAGSVWRDQNFRREREQGKNHFGCLADHKQDWQRCVVDTQSAERDVFIHNDVHRYMHTYIDTNIHTNVLSCQFQPDYWHGSRLPQMAFIPRGTSAIVWYRDFTVGFSSGIKLPLCSY